jgi:hypothetical protein
MAGHTDGFADVTDVLGPAGQQLVDRVRTTMAPDPTSPEAHRAAMAAYGGPPGP